MEQSGWSKWKNRNLAGRPPCWFWSVNRCFPLKKSNIIWLIKPAPPVWLWMWHRRFWSVASRILAAKLYCYTLMEPAVTSRDMLLTTPIDDRQRANGKCHTLATINTVVSFPFYLKNRVLSPFNTSLRLSWNWHACRCPISLYILTRN